MIEKESLILQFVPVNKGMKVIGRDLSFGRKLLLVVRKVTVRAWPVWGLGRAK